MGTSSWRLNVPPDQVQSIEAALSYFRRCLPSIPSAFEDDAADEFLSDVLSRVVPRHTLSARTRHKLLWHIARRAAASWNRAEQATDPFVFVPTRSPEDEAATREEIERRLDELRPKLDPEGYEHLAFTRRYLAKRLPTSARSFFADTEFNEFLVDVQRYVMPRRPLPPREVSRILLPSLSTCERAEIQVFLDEIDPRGSLPSLGERSDPAKNTADHAVRATLTGMDPAPHRVCRGNALDGTDCGPATKPDGARGRRTAASRTLVAPIP